jgi:long-subunit acyl-CoA synthetase (AMP-forming)
MTPTMKVRRREVEQKYQADLDRLYSDEHFGLTA